MKERNAVEAHGRADEGHLDAPESPSRAARGEHRPSPFDVLGVPRHAAPDVVRTLAAPRLAAAMDRAEATRDDDLIEEYLETEDAFWKALHIASWRHGLLMTRLETSGQPNAGTARPEPEPVSAPVGPAGNEAAEPYSSVQEVARLLAGDGAFSAERLWATDPAVLHAAMATHVWHRSAWRSLVAHNRPGVVAMLLRLRSSFCALSDDPEPLLYEVQNEELEALANESYLVGLAWSGALGWLIWERPAEAFSVVQNCLRHRGFVSTMAWMTLPVTIQMEEERVLSGLPGPLEHFVRVGTAVRPDLSPPLLWAVGRDMAARPRGYAVSLLALPKGSVARLLEGLLDLHTVDIFPEQAREGATEAVDALVRRNYPNWMAMAVGMAWLSIFAGALGLGAWGLAQLIPGAPHLGPVWPGVLATGGASLLAVERGRRSLVLQRVAEVSISLGVPLDELLEDYLQRTGARAGLWWVVELLSKPGGKLLTRMVWILRRWPALAESPAGPEILK